MPSTNFPRMAAVVIGLLFLALFAYRGASHALVDIGHGESIDFGPIYGATRAWFHGGDPYSRPNVNSEFRAGGGTRIINPNVYFPTILPFAAIASWARWETAIRIWLAIGLVAWALALWGASTFIPSRPLFRYLVVVYGMASWPAAMNIRWGQPCTVSSALAIWSVWASTRNRLWISGILLGLSASWKPTIAAVAILFFLVRRKWQPLLVGAVTFGAIYAGVILTALPSSLGWSGELRTTIASTAIYAIKGNDVNDFVNLQPLIGVFTENPALLNGIAYLVVASILLAFVLKTRKVRPEDLPAEQLALVVPLALLPVYHRYPDLFLLIGAMPLCLVFYHERRYRLLAGLSGIIALLSIPLQTMAALVFRQTVQNDSAADLIRFVSLFRHQQLLLVTLALLVIFSTSGVPGRDFVARVYRLRGEQIPSIGKVEEKTPPQET